MHRRISGLNVLAVVGTLAAMSLAATSAAAAGSACDRRCLRALLEQYLAAVVKHDPGAVPLTPGFRQTENAQAVVRGEGVWQSIASLGRLQRYYVDAVNQSAGYYGTILEGGDAGIATLRLQIVDRKISEAEWIIGRKDTGTPAASGPGATSVEGAELSPPPQGPLPREQRVPRADMMAVVNSYFDSLQGNNPALFIGHPGWLRIENGIGTGEGAGGMGRGPNAGPYQGRVGGAGNGPVADAVSAARARNPAAIAQPACGGICGVVARRYPVIDEEAGVALGLVIFQRPPGNTNRRNLLSEWFAIDHGKVRGIYAAMHYLAPTIAAPNWPPFDGNWPLGAPAGAAPPIPPPPPAP